MLRLTGFRPSFKQGNGAAQTPAARVNEAASAGAAGPIAMKSVAARLGFKRVIGKPKKPTFEFQEALKTGSDAELFHQRTLMKNAASRVYNQMGMSVKTHEAARASLIWLNQYRETLTEGEERDIADRLAIRMGDIVEEFLRIRKDKVALADELEHALTKTKRDTRLARAKKLSDEETAKRQKGENSFMDDEAHPDTANPSIPVDPELVLQRVQDEIKTAEKAKKAAKSPKKKAVKEDDENETSESFS